MRFAQTIPDSPFDRARSRFVVIGQSLSPRLQLVVLLERDICLLDRPRHPSPDQATSPERRGIGVRSFDMGDLTVHADEKRPLRAWVPGQFGHLSRCEVGIKVGRICHAICLVKKQADSEYRGERRWR